jgi:hypothetical protein
MMASMAMWSDALSAMPGLPELSTLRHLTAPLFGKAGASLRAGAEFRSILERLHAGDPRSH